MKKLIIQIFLHSGLLIMLSACNTDYLNDEDETQTSNDKDTNTSSDSDGNNTTSQNKSCFVSAEQTAILNRINYERSKSQVCGTKKFVATTALKWDCDLLKAAEKHSNDMANNNFFSHYGSDGLKVDARVNSTNYRWRYVGENIAAGYSTYGATITALMNSPSHCETIMNPDYNDFAMAVVKTNRQYYRTYWTQVFGTEQ